MEQEIPTTLCALQRLKKKSHKSHDFLFGFEMLFKIEKKYS